MPIELRRSPGSIVALAGVVLLVTVAANDGGFFELTHLPAALLALGLLVVGLMSVSTRTRVPRMVRAAVALLLAYAAWSYLSILWADDQGLAWEGANRTLMYAIVFALFAVWPLRERAAAIVLGAVGLGVAGLGLVTLVGAVAADDVADLFVGGRLAAPIGYTNGNVALWSIGLFPCIVLAARREVAPVLRALALAGAGLLAALALLGQSRGWLVALPIASLLFLLVVPGRLRNAVALAVVALALLPSAGPILDVFASYEATALTTLLDRAAPPIFASALVLGLLGLLTGIAERRVEPTPHVARQARTAVGAALAVVAAGAVIATLVAVGDPVEQVSDAVATLEADSAPSEQPTGTVRFTSVAGQNRFDYWDVALSQLADDPLLGAGVGNFQDAYLARGDSIEQPLFPHSLELRVLSQTGLIGALLFAAASGAALAAAFTASRRGDPFAGAIAGAALAGFLYWALHGSIDWLFELPGLAGLAFALLGLACASYPRRRLDGRRRSAPEPLARGRRRVAALACGGLLCALALALPLLAQLHVERSLDQWQVRPDAALEGLDRAAALNPLSSEPHVTAAAIALRLGRLETARRNYEAALELNRGSAFVTFSLGALSSELGDQLGAIKLLIRAARLSPNDELIRATLRDALAAERIDAEAVYERALERRSALADG